MSAYRSLEGGQKKKKKKKKNYGGRTLGFVIPLPSFNVAAASLVLYSSESSRALLINDLMISCSDFE